jgi:hypothetical protein
MHLNVKGGEVSLRFRDCVDYSRRFVRVWNQPNGEGVELEIGAAGTKAPSGSRRLSFTNDEARAVVAALQLLDLD